MKIVMKVEKVREVCAYVSWREKEVEVCVRVLDNVCAGKEKY